MKKKNIFVLLLLATITLVAWGSTFLYVKVNNEEKKADQLIIMTSCNPVYITTLNVTENCEGVLVENLSQPSTGCLHDYSLTTEDMKNLSHADALVISGGGMEGYLGDVMAAYPELTIIDASAGLDLITEEDEDEHHHEGEEEEHEGHEDHDHGSINSHYWLSQSYYIAAINNIAEGLCSLDSAHTDIYTDNASQYIDKVCSQLAPLASEIYNEYHGQDIAILHEAYSYIAMDISSQVTALMDLDEERQVSAAEVAELIDEIQEHNIQIVLAEADYGKAMGDLIEEQTEAKVVYLNTLIHGHYDKDSYIKEMAENYSIIKGN